MMTSFAYCRVSSFDQRQKGLSIDAQTDRLKALGIDEKNIYIDAGKTAGMKEDMVEYNHDGRYFNIRIDTKPRPAFQQMMSNLKAGDELYFTKIDRISRSIFFTEAFIEWCKRRKITLIPLDDTMDRLPRRILAIVAEEELHKTKARNDDIFKAIYDRGGFPYKAPIGYDKNIKTKTGLKYPALPESSLITIDAEMDMVIEIFGEMGEGKDYKEICEKHKIQPQTLYDIIRNKTYLGMTHYQSEWKSSGLVPAIITQEQYEKANANIKKK